MATAKEEKIIKLRRGIASPQTPDYIRERMQAELDELLKPEPAPVVETTKPVSKKPTKAKPAPKKEVKVETPPPPPVPSLTIEEKEQRKKELQQKMAKKRAKSE